MPDSLIEYNETFFDMLDANGVVGIGRNLYRYSYSSQKLFTISNADAADQTNYTAFLNGNLSNPTIGAFPLFVDVLEAIDAGYRTMPDTTTIADPDEIFKQSAGGLLGDKSAEWKYFNDAHVEGSYTQGWQNSSEDNTRMDGKLAYDKFAIYFHFYGKEKYQTNRNWAGWWITEMRGSSNSSIDWWVNYNYSYLRKGRGQYTQSNGGVLYPGNNVGNRDNQANKTFYDGSRGLVSGRAIWDVRNGYSNRVSKVVRNGGSGDYTMPFINQAVPANDLPNFELSTGSYKFNIRF